MIFSVWLADEMIARGYGHNAASLDKARFARDLGVVETTVANWLDSKNLPTMRAVVLLAKFFGYSTETVLNVAGYEIVPSAGDAKRNERSAAILAALPRLQRLIEMIGTKTPAEQDIWFSVVEKLLKDEPPPS